jgi:hypothetical protein
MSIIMASIRILASVSHDGQVTRLAPA